MYPPSRFQDILASEKIRNFCLNIRFEFYAFMYNTPKKYNSSNLNN